MSSESEQPIIVSADSSSQPVARTSRTENAPRRRHRNGRRTIRISLILFSITCVSTFFAGFFPGDPTGAWKGFVWVASELVQEGAQLTSQQWFQLTRSGAVFGGCLMAILLAHEMGHFLLAKYHRVAATPPFFIPMPFGPFGTMGAVILQDAHRANRRQLFDIAIAGPLAGLVVALPVLIYGVTTSEVVAMQVGGGPRYGDPLLVQWIVAAIHGGYGPNEDILINAPLFAGWVGVFITALNLLPVGQLDGGHILYSLIRRKAHPVAMMVILGGIGWMAFTKRMDYALILLLLLVIGPMHPPTSNDHAHLGVIRYALGWLTLAFIIIGFTPTPIVM